MSPIPSTRGFCWIRCAGCFKIREGGNLPISHNFNSPSGWVGIRVSGSPSDEELLAGTERILSDPQLPESPRILSDHRDMEVDLSTGFVGRAVELLSRFSSTLEASKIALVTANTTNYGMLRMLSLRADSIPVCIEVFSNIRDAEGWLEADVGEDTSA